MRSQVSKTLGILGGIATLALGSTFMLRLSAPKAKAPQHTRQPPCAPRLLELERAVCDSPLVVARSADLAQSP
jgi:hypothetical protein